MNLLLKNSPAILQDLERLLELAPNFFGKDSRSIKSLFESLNSLEENDSNYYFILGNICLIFKDLNEALKNFERASFINPERAELYHCLALVLFGLSEYERAIKNWTVFLNLNPDEKNAFLAYKLRGQCY